MNSYISHSRNFDFVKELYIPIRESRLNTEHFFLLPHEDSDTVFPTKDYFESQECDMVIAEVSYPSTGQGIELGWAEMLHIPITQTRRKNITIVICCNKQIYYV